MISEKELSEYFHSFWQQHFPLLNSTFVRRFNSEHKERILTADGNPIAPVPLGDKSMRFDLIAEIAFETARQSRTAGASLENSNPVDRAHSKIASLKRESGLPPATSDEIEEASALGDVYESFFQTVLSEPSLSFRPKINGAGILSQMEADICSETTFVEVKAVHRNIQAADLRQVVCYLVAGLGSHEYRWKDFCIFNPRMAVHYSGNIDELLGYLSGRTASECIYGVLEALMDREQPIEFRF